jgi:RHS repeat-associated protein
MNLKHLVRAISVTLFLSLVGIAGGWMGARRAPSGGISVVEGVDSAGIYVQYSFSSPTDQISAEVDRSPGPVPLATYGAYDSMHPTIAGNDHGIVNGTSYTYTLKMVEPGSMGNVTTTTTASIFINMGTPALSIARSGGNYVLTWSSVPYISQYYIYSSTSPSSGFTRGGPFTATTATYTAPGSGANYYYVSAYDINLGEGAPSNEVSTNGFVPTAEPPSYAPRKPETCADCRSTLKGEPVDLATGVESYEPDADLTVFNPTGPSVSWGRTFNSALATGGYNSPGQTNGWVHSYDTTIQAPLAGGSWSALTLVPPNGATETITPVLSGGTPTGAFTTVAGAPYLVTGVASGTTGQWTSITITGKDRSQQQFTLLSGGTYVPTKISNRMGQAIHLAWDSTRRLTSITDDASVALMTLAYNTDGTLASVSDRYSRSVYYTEFILTGPYLGMKVLSYVSQIVATGTSSPPIRWSYGYSTFSHRPMLDAIAVLNPVNNTHYSTGFINYDTSTAKVNSVVDANGNKTVFTYGSGSTDVKKEDSSGTVFEEYTQKYTLSSAGVPLDTGITDVNGHSTSLVYGDSTNPTRPTQMTDRLSLSTYFTYDSFGNLKTVTSPKTTVTTNTWVYTNFALGELSSTQEGSKTGSSFTYYEPSGLLDTATAPTPGTTSGSTVTTTLSYDSVGNLTNVLSPGNATVSTHSTTFGYTDNGQTEKLGKPTSVTTTLSHVSYVNYDSRGNVSSTVDANSNTHSFTYNLADQVLTTTNPATGQTGSGHSYTQNTYLTVGGPLLETDLYDESGSLQRSIDYTYGNEGELLQESGNTLTKSYTYDAAYRLKSVKDGNNHSTVYSYNTLGELTLVTYPDSHTVQYTSFDNEQRVLQRIDPNGVTTNYTYADGDGLLSAVSYPATTSINVGLSYDSYDRLTSVTEGTGSRTYTYDDRDGRLSEATVYGSMPTVTSTLGYNNDASVSSMGLVQTGGFSYSFAYGYDGDGRMNSLANPFSESTGFSYQDNDWLSSQTMANGVAAGYTYNGMGQLIGLLNSIPSSSTTLSQFSSFGYDASGNMLGVAASYPSATTYSGTITNTFDSADQLASSGSTQSANPYSHAFTVDAAGNMTAFRSSSTNYSFNNRNEITNTSFAYDNNGNATSWKPGSTTYTAGYDAENRMTSFYTAFHAGYRADGLRGWKQGASTTTYYIYGLDDNPVVEIFSTGSVAAVNTFGPNGLISRRVSSTSTFYAFDQRGNTVQRLSNTGSVLTTITSDEYGVITASGSPGDPYGGFGGQFGYYRDAETGFYLLGHRYYDQNAGRFLNEDPIGFGGGINVHSYTLDNPFSGVDPSGYDQDPLHNPAALAAGWESGVGEGPKDCGHWLAEFGGFGYPGQADTWPKFLKKHGWTPLHTWYLEPGDIITIIKNPKKSGIRDNGHVMGVGDWIDDKTIDLFDASDRTHNGRQRPHYQGNPFHGFYGSITIWRYKGKS